MDSGSTNERGAGTTFGSFRIVRRLAIGGSAEIFLARDASGGRRVLKVPFESGSAKDERNDAIAHEAAIGARLDHPAIVRIEGVARERDTLALVEEYVDGVSLDALLEATRVPAEVALRILVTLAGALDVAHRAVDERGVELGLVHRDLHPHNVLISRDGDVKLLDFGIARSRLATSRTRTGTLKGTLRYLAPEQATSSELDRRTDVYALGLLGFEMLAHEPYLAGSNDVELLRAAEDPPARPLDASVLPEVRATIERALRRFPEERFGTALAFAARLDAFAGPEDSVREFLSRAVVALLPPETAEPPSRPDSAPRRGGRIPWRAVTLGAIGMSMTAVAFGLYRARTPAPSTITPPEPRVAFPLDVPRASNPSVDSRSVGPPEEAAPDPSPNTPRTIRERATPPEQLVAVAQPEPGTLAPAAPEVATEPPSLATRDAVRAKLARADAALRSARARGDDVRRSEALSRDALSAYAEGRYQDADRLLDGILADLSSTR